MPCRSRSPLDTPQPCDLLLALIAMLYGLAVLGVFASLATIERGALDRRADG